MILMQLDQIRADLARMLGSTAADGALNRQKQLHALMREEEPDNRFGRGVPIEATPMNAAMVLLAVLDNAPVSEVSERMRRLWRAHISRREKCPVTGAATIGQALTRLIAEPKLRAKLKMIELARETDTISLVWKHRDRPSVFYPDATAAAWKRRVQLIEVTRPVHLARLDGTIFARIAELIERHQ